MDAVILGAGLGTRLSPSTIYVNKHFFPVYNQPLIYFPISTAMRLGCQRLIIIINEWHRREYEILQIYLEKLKLEVILIEQSPFQKGIPSAISLSEKLVTSERFLVILGDNIFLGDHSILESFLASSTKIESVVFSTDVADPTGFGVVKRNDDFSVVDLIEKPTYFLGTEVLTGLYCFSATAFPLVKSLKESDRGETEITDLLLKLLKNEALRVQKLETHFQWADAGTVDSLLDLATKISMQSAYSISCGGYIEFASLASGLITEDELRAVLDGIPESSYKRHILSSIDSLDRKMNPNECNV